MTVTDQPASLAEALARLQTDLPTITKASKAQYGSYANLTDVSDKLLPKLGSLGLSFSAKPTWVTREDGTRDFVLAYKLRHVSGESDEGEYPLGDKLASHQALGSAITYGRRYCLCAITGAVAEDDDDGQAAATAGPVTGRQPRAKPPQRAAAALPRNRDGSTSRSQVTDDELNATGQMTDAQQRQHNRLERDTLAGSKPAERLAATPEDDPWLDAPAGQLPVPQPAADPAQAIAVHFTRFGVTDRDVRLGMISSLIGRPIKSSKEMTAYEGLALKRALGKCRDAEAFRDFFDHEADAFRADIAEHRKETASV